MTQATLYLGNKAYSSWSLRGWLACKIAGLEFREEVCDMGAPDWKTWIAARSPTGKVPCLLIDGASVWESLAIGDYLADSAPAKFWPQENAARAQARSIAAEMHAGFVELRKAMWMNVRARFPGKGRTPGALNDIARIQGLWAETRRKFGAGGPYLFGAQFGMADAMYAPVVARFVTWAPELTKDSAAYVDAVWNHPYMKEWLAAAAAEKWVLEKYETAID